MNSRPQQNVLLAAFTTFDIGGPARFFIDAHSRDDISAALDFADERRIPVFVLGGGSNLLVSDQGFPGLVVKIGLNELTFEPAGNRMLVHAAAGEDWDHLVAQAVQRDLGGVECLSGIPGSVGGTPVQNVGAYGQEISNVLVSANVLDRRTGKVRELSRRDCSFTYRSSIFNTTEKDHYIVLDVTYVLEKGAPPTIEYADVRREFESVKRPPTLAEVRSAVREIRARKSMLITPGDPDCRSAGSFFKNPVITEDDYVRLQSLIDEPVPRYSAPAGYVKTAAAWLIERSGCFKGFAIGPAAISRKHTLALVNTGGAKASDIVHLAREVRNRVEGQFGVRLMPEPVFLGFDEEF